MEQFAMPSLKRSCAAQKSHLSTLRVGSSNPAVGRTAGSALRLIAVSSSPRSSAVAQRERYAVTEATK